MGGKILRHASKFHLTYPSHLCDAVGAQVIAGFLLAHEIGHGLGMDHDFSIIHGGNGDSETSTNPCNNQGIMSYNFDRTAASTGDKWSSCSVKDFKAQYNMVKSENNGEWCLTGKHSRLSPLLFVDLAPLLAQIHNSCS